MNYKQDTIAAISTPPGIGGISVIRISGKQSIPFVAEIFQARKALNEYPSRTAVYGKITYNGKILDDVIVTKFLAPHSYTGEDVVEISCHGSVFITNQILGLLLKKCRLAEKGEFTRRAFFNEKIGLTQAEAVSDLLQAKTKFSHLAALHQFEGRLHDRIEHYLEKITELRTKLELEIDFVEQGLEVLDHKDTAKQMRELLSDLQKLAASGEEGLILREGLSVSLVGAPNVGKSSIFNALLQTSRAIVTPHPGTTRDYLEEVISLKGYLIKIFDTAGLRKTEDKIEKIGIERSYEIIKNSHKVLFIIDGETNDRELAYLQQLVEENQIIKVLNKADLFSSVEIDKFRKSNFVICSTKDETGLNELKKALLTQIEISEETLQQGILTNTRQIAAVQKAIGSLQKAIGSFEQDLGYEFTAFDLKEASSALEEIIGKVTSEEILEQIFDNFCIGK